MRTRAMIMLRHAASRQLARPSTPVHAQPQPLALHRRPFSTAPAALTAEAPATHAMPVSARGRSPRRWNEVERAEKVAEKEEWLRTELGLTPDRAIRYGATMPPSWTDHLPLWRVWMKEEWGFSDFKAMEIVRKDPVILGARFGCWGEVAQWLQSERGPGWTREQVQDVIERTPAIFAKVPSRLQRVVDWIRSDEYGQGEAHGMAAIWSNPHLLNSSVDGRCRPRYDLARELGVTASLASLANDVRPTPALLRVCRALTGARLLCAVGRQVRGQGRRERLGPARV